jgi:pimeloyl-ACP methyl ester carboxylesterase
MSVKPKETTRYTFGNFTAVEKVLTLNGAEWRYTVSGSGDEYVLAIMANISGHLLALPFAEDLGDDYTIIALSVPPLKEFALAANGLKSILDAEGIDRCHVIGHSNGGVYMQALIAKFPERVDKIIFSHSLTSMSKEDAQTINVSEIKAYKTMRGLLKILPVAALISLMTKAVLGKLRLKSGRDDTKRFLRLCKADMKRLTKRDLLTMVECMEDFLYNHTFASEPYAVKPNDVLILDSPTDKLANPMQRAQMLRLCPGTNEYHFKSGGHVTMVNCRDEYIGVLKNFWKENQPSQKIN